MVNPVLLIDSSGLLVFESKGQAGAAVDAKTDEEYTNDWVAKSKHRCDLVDAWENRVDNSGFYGQVNRGILGFS